MRKMKISELRQESDKELVKTNLLLLRRIARLLEEILREWKQLLVRGGRTNG